MSMKTDNGINKSGDSLGRNMQGELTTRTRQPRKPRCSAAGLFCGPPLCCDHFVESDPCQDAGCGKRTSESSEKDGGKATKMVGPLVPQRRYA